MIFPQEVGKIYIDGKEQEGKYDRNAPYGVYGQIVTYYEILIRIILCGFCVTISRKSKELKHGKDFMTLAFDPPVKKAFEGNNA